MNFLFDWPQALTVKQQQRCEEIQKDLMKRLDSYYWLGEVLNARLPSDVFFATLGQTWTSCDNIVEFGGALTNRLGKATRRELHLMMSDEERDDWEDLPDRIRAYRFAYDNNLGGFCYSLDKKIALRFAGDQRYIQQGNNNRFLLTALIPKEFSVLKLDREESEIIATRPQENIVLKKERLK